MKSTKHIGLIALGAVALIILGLIVWVMNIYNGFITLQTTVDEGWAQVETQYQRRADLIPNLIATVQGAADFEEGVLTEVTEARTNWLNTSADSSASIDDQMAAAQGFDSALARLLVTVENYPTLTATENFLGLQSQLEGTENRISVARRDYNALVTDYNVAVRVVPANIIAGMFGFEAYPFFESDEGAEEAPVVEFN